jgi:hypothetical protein
VLIPRVLIRVIPRQALVTDVPGAHVLIRLLLRICGASVLLLVRLLLIHAGRTHAAVQVMPAPTCLLARTLSLPVSVVPAVLLIL